MVEIKQVDIPEKKSQICDIILHALPNWFGVEASIVEYVEKHNPCPSGQPMMERNRLALLH